MKNEIVFALSLALASTTACKAPEEGGGGETPGTGGARNGGSGGSKASGGSGGGSTASGGATGSGGSGGGSPATGGGGGTATGGSTAGSGGTSTGTGGAMGGEGGSAPGDVATESSGPLPPPMTGEVGKPGFPEWKYSKAIKMDTTPAGAGITGAVANYPVAVILNATNFDFAQAKAQGEDLRFGKTDGTPIPYSVEHFDAGAKTAAIWVKIDSVKGNDNAQSFNMYWGNPTAGDASDSKGVFSTADGYLGVWHLSEDGSTTAGGYKDASAAGNHATGVALAAGSRIDGRVGKGTKTVNMMDQWIRVDDETGKFRTTNMTVSIWGKADAFPGRSGPTGYDTILSSGEYWTVQKFSRNRVFETCFQHNCAIGKTAIATGAWYHFLLVRQGGSQSFYVNGVKDAGGGVATRADFKPLGIGNQTQYLTNAGEKRSWDGILDEARALNVAKDANWAKLEFESQKEDSKFLSFGPTTMK